MRKILISLIFLVNISIVVGFWLQGNYDLIGISLPETLISLGRLTGLFLALMVLTQFVFMSRAPWIEHAFGFDKLAKAHKYNGYAVFFFLITHPFLLTYGYALNSGVTYFEQYQDFALNYKDVLPAMVAYFLYLSVIILSVVVVRKRLKYETWYIAHLFVYLATLLSFGHQISIGQTLGHSEIFRIYWIGLYLIVIGSFVVYRILRPIFNFYRHQFVVTRVVPETCDVTSVYISGRDMSNFKINPGQFMILRFLARGLWTQSHPFSLSMSPKNNEIRVSIKNSGDYTANIKNLPVGTKVVIDGPHGIFTEKLAKKEKTLFIAGGIGITPIRAILEKIASSKDCVLLYGNKTEHDIALGSELERLPIKKIDIISDDQNFQGEKGRIDGEKIAKLVPDYKERSVFICGPLPMMLAIRRDLVAMGCDKSDIHFEEFSL